MLVPSSRKYSSCHLFFLVAPRSLRQRVARRFYPGQTNSDPGIQCGAGIQCGVGVKRCPTMAKFLSGKLTWKSFTWPFSKGKTTLSVGDVPIPGSFQREVPIDERAYVHFQMQSYTVNLSFSIVVSTAVHCSAPFAGDVSWVLGTGGLFWAVAQDM